MVEKKIGQETKESCPSWFKPGRDGVRVGEDNNSHSRKDTEPCPGFSPSKVQKL